MNARYPICSAIAMHDIDRVSIAIAEGYDVNATNTVRKLKRGLFFSKRIAAWRNSTSYRHFMQQH